MKKSYCHWLFTAFLLSFLTTVSPAQVVVHHFGANDPEAVGFILGSPANAEVGPVFGDIGRDAWSINTRAGTEFGFYRYGFSAQEAQEAATYGWELSATMRLLDVPSPGGGTMLSFFNSTEGFRLTFRFDATNDALVIGASSSHKYLIADDPHGYHQFTIRFDSLTELASLWIDGQEVEPSLFAYPGSSIPSLTFGAGQAVTHSHWNEVSFTIVPEPATVALLLGIGALFFVGGVRWRMRGTKRVTEPRQ